MHRVILYTISFLLILSCKKENEITDPLVSLNICPTISVQNTKAIVDGTNVTGQSIGIQVTNAAGSLLYQSGTDNVALNYASSAWGLSSTISISSAPAKIYAYAPYSAITGDFTGIGTTAARLLNIPASQTMSGQVDYLWAAQDKTTSGGATNITFSNPSVTLTMNHALAQVAFVIYKDGYSGAGNLSQISIVDESSSTFKINKSGTNNLKMSISDGTVSGGETSSMQTITNIGNTISLTSDPGSNQTILDGSKNAYFLLAPVGFSDQAKVKFIMTIDGKSYMVSTGGTGPLSWVKGNQYIYKARLSLSSLSIQSVTMSPWTANTPTTTNDLNDNAFLSTAANCYIVAPSSSITIPVNIKGNGRNVAGTGLSVTHTAASVVVLWQTSSGLINVSNFSSANQSATITTSGSPGNGVLAAKDGSGNILWSWHIWVTDFNPNATTYNFNPDNSLTFMDRNLGATTTDYSSAGCIGLNYQWGRKDPFPVPIARNSSTEPTIYGSVTSVTALAPTAESNLPNTILYPLNFYTASNPYTDWYSSNSSIHNIDLWGGGSDATPTAKTIFDPCPAGWRVPAYRNLVNPWSVLTLGNGTFANNGRTWTTPYNAGYWPGTSTRNSGSGAIVGANSTGSYWTAGMLYSQGRHMYFTNGAVEIGNGSYKASAMAIRCVREF